MHYYLGLEVTRLIDGQHRVTCGCSTREDRSWVTGTGKTWEGRLTRPSRQRLQNRMTDEYFRGSREVPFSTAQTDLLAASLAHELTCNLLRQVAGEYVIAADGQQQHHHACARRAGTRAQQPGRAIPPCRSPRTRAR